MIHAAIAKEIATLAANAPMPALASIPRAIVEYRATIRAVRMPQNRPHKLQLQPSSSPFSLGGSEPGPGLLPELGLLPEPGPPPRPDPLSAGLLPLPEPG